MRRWRAILAVAALALVALPSPLAAQELTGTVLVYTGGGATDQGYTSFGAATGKTIVTSSSLEGIAGHDCVVLPANNSFSEGDLAALSSYVNGGGRLLALGENAEFFSATITAMNNVAAALDADLSLVADSIDPGFHTTTNIDTSPFTFAVSSIRYAFTSGVAVAVGPTAHSLVRTDDVEGPGTTFIGIEQIGAGVFALSGDTNVFSDNSDTGYTGHDNGTLAANICDAADFEGGVTAFVPAGGTLTTDNGVTSPDDPISAQIQVVTAGEYSLAEFFDSSGSSKGAAEYTGPENAAAFLLIVSCDESQCPEEKKDDFILVKKLNPDGTEVVLSPCEAGIIIKGKKTIVTNPAPCVVSVERGSADNPDDLVWTVRVLSEDPIIKAR